MPDEIHPPIEAGTRWTHRNGNVYTVLFLTNKAAPSERYPLTVVYHGENGNVWSRPADDWYRSMTKVTD